MRRIEHVRGLPALVARLDTALAILENVAREGGRPSADWRTLQSRTKELERMIAGICEDAQALDFERRGYFLAPIRKGAA